MFEFVVLGFFHVGSLILGRGGFGLGYVGPQVDNVGPYFEGFCVFLENVSRHWSFSLFAEEHGEERVLAFFFLDELPEGRLD